MQEVININNYDNVDGRNAYKSNIKKITLGNSLLDYNKNMELSIQLWKSNQDLFMELPLHQVFDLMIILSSTLLYFKDAYQLPLLYDKNKPIIDIVGLQGSKLDITINTDNATINNDILNFYQSLSNLDEIIGERFHVLLRIMKSLEKY